MHTIRYYPYEAGRTLYPIDFELGILSRDHVYVYVGDDSSQQVSYTWVSDVQISLAEPIQPDEELKIQRIVPDTLFNNYVDGARLSHENLNDSFIQALMMYQEVVDGFLGGDLITNIFTAAKAIINELDMNGGRIENLADPIEATDAVSRQFLENALTEFGENGSGFAALALEGSNVPIAGEAAKDIVAVVRELEDIAEPDTNVVIAGEDATSIVASAQGVSGLKSLKALPNIVQRVKGVYSGFRTGGDDFTYESGVSKSTHNGIDVIAPEALDAWDGTASNISQLLSWAGSGSGCFVRRTNLSGQLNSAGAREGFNMSAPIQAALNAAPTLGRIGGKVVIPQATLQVDNQITLGNTKKLQGDGGFLGSALVAGVDFSTSDENVILANGDWACMDDINIQVAEARYPRDYSVSVDPADAVNCVTLQTFGGSLNRFRTLGGHTGVVIEPRDDLTFTGESKLFHGHMRNHRVGIDISRWDTDLSNIIIEECRIGVRTNQGVESVGLHVVRAELSAIELRENGHPVNLVNTFIDSPRQRGIYFADMQGANIVNTHILKVGDEGQYPLGNFALRFEGASHYNQIHNIRYSGSTEHMESAFSFTATNIKNNVISGVSFPDKTASNETRQAAMRRQTVYGCTRETARYNNIVRNNRVFISSTDLPVAGSFVVQMTVDYDYSNSNIEFMMTLFQGHWTAYSSANKTCYGRLYVPVNTTDLAPSGNADAVVEKLSGEVDVDFTITGISLVDDLLTFTVTNTGTVGMMLSLELARSVDSRGRTF